MTQTVEGSLPSPKGFSLGMRKVPPSTLNLETVTISRADRGRCCWHQVGRGQARCLAPRVHRHSHTTENRQAPVSAARESLQP